jgi:hypothetical protein
MSLRAATAIAAAIGATSVAAAPASARVEWLDSNHVGKGHASLRSRQSLENGALYVVNVRGTFSYYRRWERRTCGTPERNPVYRTAGRRNGLVGADAMFNFAAVASDCEKADGRRDGSFYPRSRFEIAARGGSKYVLARPLDATVTKPRPTHDYSFALVGRGTRPRLRLWDRAPHDNYGRMRISIVPATAEACANNGHAAFGLATVEDCLARVAAAPA